MTPTADGPHSCECAHKYQEHGAPASCAQVRHARPATGAVPAVAAPLLLVQQTLLFFGAVVYSVTAVSLLQLATPAQMLGRMNATARVLEEGTLPVGALLGSAVATVLGVQPTLVLTAVDVGLAVLVAAASPLRSTVQATSEGPGWATRPDADES